MKRAQLIELSVKEMKYNISMMILDEESKVIDIRQKASKHTLYDSPFKTYSELKVEAEDMMKKADSIEVEIKTMKELDIEKICADEIASMSDADIDEALKNIESSDIALNQKIQDNALISEINDDEEKVA